MPYTTSLGAKVEFPYALAARAVQSGNEDTRQIVNEVHEIFRALQNSDNRVITLIAENQRLGHENAFMLTLVNNIGRPPTD